MSTPAGLDDTASSLPREPWGLALGRYGAAVLGLLGVGAILDALLGLFMDPMTWGGLLSFSLLMGAVSVWFIPGSSPSGFRRRSIAPLALGAFGLLLVVLLVVRRAGLDVPAPTAVPALAVGVLAVAASVRMSTWSGPQSPGR